MKKAETAAKTPSTMNCEPPCTPRYTLSELLAECDANALLSEEDRLWLDSAPAGRELV